MALTSSLIVRRREYVAVFKWKAAKPFLTHDADVRIFQLGRQDKMNAGGVRVILAVCGEQRLTNKKIVFCFTIVCDGTN
jgi:hypothetical protein